MQAEGPRIGQENPKSKKRRLLGNESDICGELDASVLNFNSIVRHGGVRNLNWYYTYSCLLYAVTAVC